MALQRDSVVEEVSQELYGFRADTRPMVVPMCALCTHDVHTAQEQHEWLNGAVAHLKCYERFSLDHQWSEFTSQFEVAGSKTGRLS